MSALRLSSLLIVVLIVGACAAQRPTTAPSPTHAPATVPTATGATAAPTATAMPEPTGTPEPLDTGGSTTGGDIPDNAVFLTYADAAHSFSIDYVEGWQVTPSADGVVIRDKDSSETVQVVAPVSDIPGYITSTDLPSLQGLNGFQLVKQDTVTVGTQQLNHIVYQAPSPPDPVTGKEVPSTIDRYYVPGTNGLAIVTLSTPNGVDNVDAFRTMIESFAWT